MTYVHTPSDRVQLRNLGELMHPGSCALCGNGNCEEGYLDLGIYYDYEGQMYLCVPCLKQCANVIGMIPPEEVQLHLAAAEELAQRFEAQRNELINVRERLNAYDVVLAGVRSDLPVGLAGAFQEPTDAPTLFSTDGTVSGESESKESDQDEGPSDTVRSERSDVTDGSVPTFKL